MCKLLQSKVWMIGLLLLLTSKIYAEKTVLIYSCIFIDGTIGYYDLPCDHVANARKHAAKDYTLIKEEILTLKIANYKILNKQDNLNTILPKPDHRPLPVTKEFRERHYCQKAKMKIQLLTGSLHKLGQEPKDLIKIKRSLYRSKKIAKKYCAKDVRLNNQ